MSSAARRARAALHRPKAHLAAVAGCALLGGCGSTAHVDWASPQTLVFASGSQCGPLRHRVAISIRRLVVGRRSWRVDAAIVNRTDTPVAVQCPHHPNHVRFGLAVFESPAESEVRRSADRNALFAGPTAERVVPPLPRALADGERWSGWFGAPGRLPAQAWIRVVFGQFVFPGHVPPGFVARFSCVSDKALEL